MCLCLALILALPSAGRTAAQETAEAGAQAGSAALAGAADPMHRGSRELVERLQTLLKAGDGEAIDLVEAQRVSLGGVLGPATLRAVEDHLARFAFEEAAALLEGASERAPALSAPISGEPR